MIIGAFGYYFILRTKDDKGNKRKSQPATRVGNGGTLGKTTKPPSSRPPPRPSGDGDDSLNASGSPVSTVSPRMDLSSDSAVTSPRESTMGLTRSGTGINGSNSASSVGFDVDQISRNTEQATKVADQTKQGLIKLQQQSKTVFDGMLQRLDAADKDRQRLEHALREMHKMIQAGEAQRTKLVQQNQILYQQVTDLKTQVSKESSARSALEVRLHKLEEHH
jgi:hypothetical protein